MGAGDTGQNVLGVRSVLLSALCAVMNGCPAQVHPLWAVRDHPDRCCVVALCVSTVAIMEDYDVTQWADLRSF